MNAKHQSELTAWLDLAWCSRGILIPDGEIYTTIAIDTLFALKASTRKLQASGRPLPVLFVYGGQLYGIKSVRIKFEKSSKADQKY
ncbi:hypothetical protein ACHAPU_010811 [Fusarium lateritium]